jgi:hypothetical protein
MGMLQTMRSKASSFFESTTDIFSATPPQHRTWSETEAIVTACELEPLDLELALLYVPKVTYEFSANGEEIRCTETIRQKPSFALNSKMLEEFRRGTKIRVMYNPASPRMTRLVNS